jgi:hypothetical protein
MKRFSLTDSLDADCVLANTARAGEVYHVERNSTGSAALTPVARYFAWRPEFIEGFHAYWRVDCFVRIHALSPDPMKMGEALVAALLRESLCAEPIWLSVHQSEELQGKEYGEVFDYD